MVEVFHSLIKIHALNSGGLNDVEKLGVFLDEVSKILGTEIIETSSHTFIPSGYTAYALLKESHVAIHTWPEESFAVLDILSCKKFPEDFKARVENLVKSTFSASSILFEN